MRRICFLCLACVCAIASLAMAADPPVGGPAGAKLAASPAGRRGAAKPAAKPTPAPTEADENGSENEPAVSAPKAGKPGAAPGKTTWTRDDELEAQFAELARQMSEAPRLALQFSQSLRRDAAILASDRDGLDIVLRRTAALLADIAAHPGALDLASERAELDRLRKRASAVAATDKPARLAIFKEACAVRRRVALANPLLNFRDILFVKRHLSAAHMCDQFYGCHAKPGGGLYVLENAFSDSPSVRDVLAGSTVAAGRLAGQKLAPGAFLSPDLSYDGKIVLFAYTEAAGRGGFDYAAANARGGWQSTNTFHLFRVGVDPNGAGGRDLRQLTDGNWNDFDPVWLPNGEIAFISERRGGQLRCGARPNPTYAMCIMSGDAATDPSIRPLSFHETHEWQPSVNNDGLLVYTRWDYVDRDSDVAHHPWVTTPDGRDARSLHGNFPPNAGRGKRPWMEMDIRAVPQSRKYVATAAPHHGQAYGSLVLLDPDVEDDDGMGQLRRITPATPFPESEGSRGNQHYGTAWPLSEDYFLCVYCYPNRSGLYGLYLLDSFGNMELLHADPAIGCRDPIPLRPRPMPAQVPAVAKAVKALTPAATPGKADANTPPATFACVDLYDSSADWPAGTKIAALRIVQVFPKTTQPAEGPPISGAARQSLVRGVLGTVPVEPDGSAYFTAPAGKPIYFQALDANGCAVQSMRSLTYLQSGDRVTCQGCHEHRYRAPAAPAATPLALRRQPSKIAPEVDGALPVFFPRLVQPVLDRNCIPCHAKQTKAPDLSADPVGKAWTKSYAALAKYAFGFSGGNGVCGREGSRTTPGRFGAMGSKLYPMLLAGHPAGARPKLKLSAEDLRRVILWLDCNSNFYGAYHDVEKQNRGELILPDLE
jgi:hypothetical protein